MIKNLDASSSTELIPLLTDLGYPEQNPEDLKLRIERFLTNSNCWIYGYFEKGALIGFSSLSFIPLIHEDGYLGRVSALAIRKDHQGHGVGRRLMSHMEAVCRAQSCVRIELTSGAHRESTAHRFYLALGYEKSSGARFVKNIGT